MKTKPVIIIGAGPAGLTAAYRLQQAGIPTITLETDPQYVGGISRTVVYKGFRFDIGGHRFFSKSQQVEDFWTEILGSDLLDRPRSSRIYYRGKFFAYPLKPFEALMKLGIFEACRCVLSYAKAKVLPIRPVKSFQDWVINQFGARLFGIFFKTYTEKVWGMDCRDIAADWAAQRIKGLSLASAVLSAFKPKPKDKNKTIKTLIDTFRYPRLGPGMMWERCAEKVCELGGQIQLGCHVERLVYQQETKEWEIYYKRTDGTIDKVIGQAVISSAPIRETVAAIEPALPKEAMLASQGLKYRDFITVALVVNDKDQFDDNWIYIHEPGVKVGRVQNFKSWSPELLPDPSKVCYGLEYFCHQGDSMWNSKDDELIELATKEIMQIGLAKTSDVVDGCVVRQAKAYPVYCDTYLENVAKVRNEIESRFPTFYFVGRNGMHKYNNQDHAMMTAMLTVENIIAGRRVYDVWQVNQDAEYHEAGAAGEGSGQALRHVPTQVATTREAA
mgnify:CR=1 FL=1